MQEQGHRDVSVIRFMAVFMEMLEVAALIRFCVPSIRGLRAMCVCFVFRQALARTRNINSLILKGEHVIN
jgi:hypothetical protein